MNEQKHTMTGVWALNALSAEERARIEEYLAQDPDAAAEAHSFQETAGELARSVDPIVPRPEIKDAVMARIARTRQLPPLPAEGAEGARPVPRADAPLDPGHRLADAAAPEEGRGHEDTSGHEDGVVPLARYRASVRRSRWFAIAAAFLLVTSITGLGLWGLERNAQQEAEATIQALEAERSEADQRREVMATIMAADDATHLSLPSQTGGSVDLMYSTQHESMLVSAHGLAELPESSDYQLWLIGPDGPVDAGLLPGADGSLTLQAPMDGVESLGVTVEPAGGSEQPTTDQMIAHGDL